MALPYLVPATVLGRAGGAAPSHRITLGFIGVGAQGHSLLKSFLDLPGTEVLAVCDVDKLKLERARNTVENYYGQKSSGTYKLCAAYGDFRDLLGREDIEAVVVATPDHWHAIVSIEACRAGKDVYCEKPLSATIGEARAMVNAARRYGRVFQTGSMQRSDSRFRLACELVRNGYIGELKTITVNIGGPAADGPLAAEPVPDYLNWDMWLGPAIWRPYSSALAPHMSVTGWPQWRQQSDFGGGGMTDWGAHHFDIAQWGMGMDDSGPVEILPPQRGSETVTYRYANGVTMARGKAKGILFTGAKGWVDVTRGAIASEPANLVSQTIGANEIHLYDSGNHYVDWLDAIRKRSRPICDVEIGCRSATVCHLGNITHVRKRHLKWDPVKEEFVGDDEANRLLWRPCRSPWRI